MQFQVDQERVNFVILVLHQQVSQLHDSLETCNRTENVGVQQS
jgi:hypothetical protein